MEKSNKTGNKGSESSVEKTILSLFQVPLEKEKELSYTKTNTVSIQCLIDATVKITGTVTGQPYVFFGAGAILEVDIKDADDILNKKKGRACCGGNSGANLFQVV